MFEDKEVSFIELYVILMLFSSLLELKEIKNNSYFILVLCLRHYYNLVKI